jgi:hypothetical protein
VLIVVDTDFRTSLFLDQLLHSIDFGPDLTLHIHVLCKFPQPKTDGVGSGHIFSREVRYRNWTIEGLVRPAATIVL